MGIIDKVKDKISYQIASYLIKGGYDSVFLRNREYLLTDDDVTGKPYSKNNLVYACCTATMRAIAQVPLVVEKWQKRNIYEPMPPNHPWMRLFFRPNILLDEYSFKEAIVGHLMLDGHIFVVKNPPKAKIPDELMVVPKKYMEKITNENSGQLLGWTYKPGKKKGFDLFLDEIASVWFWNPDDPHSGLSPLDAAKVDIQTDYKAGKWNQNFFDNDASPGGVLQTDKRLLPGTVEKLRTQFEERHQGFNRSHRVAVLDQGLKYQVTGLSHNEMQFLDLRKFTHKGIMWVLGMKPAILDSEGLNYAVAKQERKEWWLGTNVPIMNLIASALSFSCFGETQEYRVRFRVETVEALQEDHLLKARTMSLYTSRGAPFNIVNKTLDLGFPDIPGGDVGFLPRSMAPVLQLINESNKPNIDGPDPDEDSDDGKSISFSSKNDPYEKEWSLYMNSWTPVINTLNDKISRVLFDLRKELLEGINGKGNFIKKYNKSIDYLDRNVPQILSSVPSFAPNISNYEIADMNERYDKEFITYVNRSVNNLLASHSKAKLPDGIKQLFNQLSKKAKQIACFQVMSKANELRNMYLAQNFKKRMWYVPVLERSGIHARLNGQINDWSSPWLINGEHLRFPCDPNANPRQTVGCNCIEIGIN